MDNDQKPVDMTLDFAEVIEKLLNRIVALEKRADSLERAAHLQAQLTSKVGQAVEGHQKIFEAIQGRLSAGQNGTVN